MTDQNKSREQLIAELLELRQRVAEQDAQLVRSRRAEADQRQFNSSLPVLVATAGLDGYYREVNAAFERILGWSEQESLARPFLDFIHPEDRATAVEAFARLQGGTQAVNFLDRNICKDGSHRWINWIVVPVPGRDIVFRIGQDITERKLAEDDRERAQEAIRQSEQRMRLHVQQTPLAVIEWDANRRVTHWNPGAERVFGYTEQEALGTHYFLVTPLESREHVEHVWSALLVKKGGERSTNENVTKAGRAILCEWYNTPLVNAEGQVIGVASLAEDITERKRAEQQLQEANERLERRIEERTAELQQANELLQAELEQRRQVEEALRESEQRMQMALEVSRSFAFEWDVATDRVLRSDSCSRVLGLSGDEAPRDTVQESFQRIHADDRDRFVRMLGELRPSASTYRTEYRMIRGDGTAVVLEESARGFFDSDGKLYRLVGVATDITEHKRAEAELRASEERFALVVRGAGVGIWDWDVRTGKVYYSPRWKMLFGYGENEIGDGFDDWTMLLHPDDRDRFVKFQEDLLAGASSNITAEYRLRHKDGSYRWIAGHGVVLRDEQGKAIRLVGSHVDITDRKRVEEELRAEQRAIRRILIASDHERRLLTYEIHDGPVQQLVGALMLFQSPALQKVWQSPETEAAYREGMAALLHAQLELRSLTSSLRTPVLEAFGVVDAIEDVARELRLAPGAPEIECRDDVRFKRLEPALENSLYRIAQEAMTNACRHSESEKVRATLTQEGDHVTLEVRDWGIGFDQDTVRENRFGLEGIRERCRILGGELSIESKPGEGTVVRAKFPVIEAAGECAGSAGR